MESIFHEDSYGYRRAGAALDAVAKCRERCWKKDWVLDLDVQKFFDSVTMGSHGQGGRGQHRSEMGGAVCEEVAYSADADARWQAGGAGPWYPAGQYCLVKPLGVSLLTFPQRHAREFVDDLLIRLPCFHFACCSDIFSPWAKPGLVLQWFQVRV